MDIQRIRAFADAALRAQAELEAAERAEAAAKKAIEEAREKHRKEVTSLQGALTGSLLLYNGKIIRIAPRDGVSSGGQWLHQIPIVSIPAIGPPPEPVSTPAVESAPPQPEKPKNTPPASKAAPLAGGKIPELKK